MNMRMIALALAMLLGLSGAALAQQPLSISDMQVDFGSMTEGPAAQKTVTLTNNGVKEVAIANVTTSCSCTSTVLGKTILKPGETTDMVITYTTYKYPGKFDKTISVYTGEDKDKPQVIHIVGYVDPVPMGVMEVEPRKISVGELAVGKPNAAALKVTNAGDAPMKVSAVKSQKFKKTYWEGDLTVKPGESATIELALTPSEPGNYLDVVMIHSDARNDIGKGYKAVLTGEAK